MNTLLNYRCLSDSRRRGVSLIEVLFAMMIAVFGLAGVLAIIPLAIRQASDSYQLTHATNGALSASAIGAAADSLMPSEKAPWIVMDDKLGFPSSNSQDPFNPPLTNLAANVAHPYKPIRSLDDLVTGLRAEYAAELTNNNPNPPLPLQEAIRRQLIGQGYCYDPLYCSYVNRETWIAQGKTWQTAFAGFTGPNNELFRPTRMPFYVDGLTSPVDSGTGRFGKVNDSVTPRLIRVTSLASRNATLPFPLANGGAEQLTSQLGDIIQATIQKDKSYGALREFEGADSGTLLNSAGRSDLSWLATIVPIESRGTEYPTQFKVSIVVLAKRDRSFEIPDPASIEELPVEERVAFVTAMGSATAVPFSKGPILNTTFQFDNRTDANLRVGNYVMLSRFVYWNLPDTTNDLSRLKIHRHRWYRIIGVGDSFDDPDANNSGQQISRDIILQGEPWDYPDQDARINLGSFRLPVAAEVQTIATIMDNVVAVYEYPVSLR